MKNPGNCVTQLHWRKLFGEKQDVLDGKKRGQIHFYAIIAQNTVWEYMCIHLNFKVSFVLALE